MMVMGGGRPTKVSGEGTPTEVKVDNYFFFYNNEERKAYNEAWWRNI